MDYIEEIENYWKLLSETFKSIDNWEIEKALNCLTKARDEKRFIYSIGNGGSAATASHFAGDFTKGLSLGREKKFRFISLTDNAPTVLSLANDVSYDSIFVEQLKNFLEPGDIVVAISGSGNSTNIIQAVEFANKKGATVIGLTGFDGGKLMQLSDIKLQVPLNNMQIVEDIHMIFNHMMMFILYSKK
ncbi:phosphoheptose isomerase [Sphaerochaeta pleomorpha str. Grapes]|uniref:Phosphoheptose isomerase n=1 Tax=Sphaerochaeta pleomorpha (strain ATCC BAA-1885 / DSM 22778 / Grapes) TaxID=158190 RepID=G8QXI2_SPHPG|nr:SIS domain-containing protein [Sphaerochaeta pleomorpha]AEV29545.1 phosphoheptose isomerase [Sphaerochaeta pleomorpha str. Grapes]